MKKILYTLIATCALVACEDGKFVQSGYIITEKAAGPFGFDISADVEEIDGYKISRMRNKPDLVIDSMGRRVITIWNHDHMWITGKEFKTAKGVYPGMLLSEAENRVGKLIGTSSDFAPEGYILIPEDSSERIAYIPENSKLLGVTLSERMKLRANPETMTTKNFSPDATISIILIANKK